MQIDLRYGNSHFSFDALENVFETLGTMTETPSLTDAEIGAALENPVSSQPVEEIIKPGETVLIVVPDATRQTACDSIVNLLIRRLIANGTMPYEISVIFATGIHRAVTPEEKQRLLTPFILQRIKTIDHKARDLMRIAGFDSRRFAVFGEINGAPAELNRALVESDHVILVGGVLFHYFAGFTGGRKLICPGLASERTIAATHRLAFDSASRRRRAGVGPGLLQGNAVHEAFESVASNVAPSFAINTIVNDRGEAAEVFCGDWIESHRAACESFAASHTIEIGHKRDLVIVSCGGAPFDLNMIQAHKALEAASHACVEGGTIVLLAECGEGLGREDFLKWFRAVNSSELAEMLNENYEVNGQTAWSLLDKAERFEIKIVTSLSRESAKAMRLQKIDSVEVPSLVRSGYVMPFGAKFLVRQASPAKVDPKLRVRERI